MATTLQNVIDRIRQDYLNRPSDLEAETVRAVQAAIRHYERKRYPWTENGSATLTTSAATSFLALPTDFLILDHLQINYNGNHTDLITATFADITRMNDTSFTGVPTHFAMRGNNLHFTPIPDSAYAVTTHYIQQLTALTATSLTGTNDWLSAAEDVIVYHATKLIWANVLRNTEEATKFFLLEKTALSELEEYRAQREFTALKPTQF